MIKKKVNLVFWITLLVVMNLSLVKALSDSDYQTRTLNNFKIYIRQTEGFGIQNYDNHVSLICTNGNLNGTNGNGWAAKNYGGSFTFTNNENCNLTLIEDIGAIRVSGGLYDGDTGYGNGSLFRLTPGNTYTFEWSFTIQPFLPFSLMLGLIGVAMLFGGSIWAIHSGREGEYRVAVNGVIVTLVGAALVIGWFW